MLTDTHPHYAFILCTSCKERVNMHWSCDDG